MESKIADTAERIRNNYRNQGFELGRRFERERILALIEEHTYKYNDSHIMFLLRDKLLERIKND